jgi:hypothetical protein
MFIDGVIHQLYPGSLLVKNGMPLDPKRVYQMSARVAVVFIFDEDGLGAGEHGYAAPIGAEKYIPCPVSRDRVMHRLPACNGMIALGSGLLPSARVLRRRYGETGARCALPRTGARGRQCDISEVAAWKSCPLGPVQLAKRLLTSMRRQPRPDRRSVEPGSGSGACPR